MKGHLETPFPSSGRGDLDTGPSAPRTAVLLSSALVATLLVLAFVAQPAHASKGWGFKEVFGGSNQPEFGSTSNLAVDQATGDVLVADNGANEQQQVTVSATAGQFRLSFGGQSTGWTGQGTLSPNSTAVTSLSTTTGSVSKGEEISGPGIKANTKISACVPTNCVGATSLTLSQTTEASAGGSQSLSSDLPFNVSSTNLREALERIPSIGVASPTNVEVTGGPGNATGTPPYTVTFQGVFAFTDVAQLSCENGAVSLSGGSGCSVATTVSARPRGVSRWHPDGTPDNFTALGSNLIDGKGGADTTPLGSVLGFRDDQIAVDNSCALQNPPLVGPACESFDPANGNIYVTNHNGHVVDIFSSQGTFLGRLTAATRVSPSATEPLSEPVGVGVDQHGVVYVIDHHPGEAINSKIDRFAPSGTFPVNTDAVFPLFAPSLTISQIGNVAVGLGPTDGYFFLSESAMNGGIAGFAKRDSTSGAFVYGIKGGGRAAVEPETGHIFVNEGSKITEYDASGGTEATRVAGIENAGSTVGSSAVAKGAETLYLARAGNTKLDVYHEVPIPDPFAGPPSVLSGAKATVTGTVKPNGVTVTECFFEYGKTTSYGSTAPCEGSIPADSGEHAVTGKLSGMLANGATYHYRLVVKGTVDPQARSADTTLVTANTYLTDPASDLSQTEATLNGTVRLEGIPLTGCEFEYGETTDYGHVVACEPNFAAVPTDDVGHPVTGAIGGLEPSSTYHYRLVAQNALGKMIGADRTFTTMGAPRIVEQKPLDATQTGATLRAQINPAGASTTYYFEWGQDGSYGNRIPADHELFVGSGNQPVKVNANLAGLDPASVYNFRVVATNSFGTTVGPDQRLETLNQHDLPDNRGIELVSPADKGPSGSVSDLFGFDEQLIEAASGGDGIVYPIQNGIPDSTAGGWTRWLADRGQTGWLSTQLSAPSLIPATTTGIQPPSRVEFVAPDLGCAVIRTQSPLTADTPQLDVELGIKNLYLWDGATGTYELITNRVPLNPGINFEPSRNAGYDQVEASDDCSRVYFHSLYSFIAGASGLYEWHAGALRDAGVLPDGSVGASLGAKDSGAAVAGGEPVVYLLIASARWNAVSPNGSRLFFTAKSDSGGDSGTPAVFMRSDGATVTDISQSTTAVPSKGARFEAASPDGQRAFFRANYGIASTTSTGATNQKCGPLQNEETAENATPPLEAKPCDLYAYDVASGQLTDISADSNPADTQGAQIQGTVAVDEDGSHVYFAALGQLIPGKGRTYAQNVAGEGSANIYLYDSEADPGEELSYVTTLNRGTNVSGDLFGGSNVGGNGVIMHIPTKWGAETTSDGSKLLFQSASNLTGYDVSGGKAVYLYSAETRNIACLSCPPDGTPTQVRPNGQVEAFLKSPQLLARPREPHTTNRRSSMSEDGSRVVFTSPDVLAPGAEPGKRNVYLWEEGQVSLLTIAQRTGGNGLGEFLDMSADGNDVFVATSRQLVSQDKDFVSDVYDFRVDGGLPEPTSPPPCQVDEAIALLPNQIYCQGASSSPPPAPAAASAGFSGPGNPAQQESRPKHCRKGKVKRHGKCVKKRHRRASRHHAARAAGRYQGGTK